MKKFVLLLMICVLGIHVFAGDIDEAQVPKVVKECVIVFQKVCKFRIDYFCNAIFKNE